MQNDPATAGVSEPGHPDLVDVTVQDGKYTIRQIAGGDWECLRYGEPWPAFADRQPDNLHVALAYEVDHLRDRVDGLGADLDSAVEVAFRHGATDWVRLNYPKHFERLISGPSAPATHLDADAAAYDAYRVLPASGHTDGFGPNVPALKHAFYAGIAHGRSAPAPQPRADPSTLESRDGAHALSAWNILEVWPGDKFILRVDGYPSLQQIERIQDKFKEFAGEDAKLLVLDKSAELSILRGVATEQILPSESRESAHAGSDPALGAEAVAGTDAGGTAAFPEVEDLINLLLERDADKIRLVEEFPHRCGLDLPMNDADDGEFLNVAELSVVDSGYGPMLWRLAIAVLQSRRAAMKKD